MSRPRYPVTVCLLLGGLERTIMVGGKPYVFEYTPGRYGGPMPVTKSGSERQLGPRHKFWTAVTHWIQQGEKMNPDGTCAWAEPPPFDLERDTVLVGRRRFLRPGARLPGPS